MNSHVRYDQFCIWSVRNKKSATYLSCLLKYANQLKPQLLDRSQFKIDDNAKGDDSHKECLKEKTNNLDVNNDFSSSLPLPPPPPPPPPHPHPHLQQGSFYFKR